MAFSNKYLLLALGIILVAFTRLLPHEFNYSPMAALALFAGAKFENRYLKVFVPLIATFITDVLLNNFFYKNMFPTFTFFYEGWYMVYLSYILIVVWGSFYIKKDTIHEVFDSSIVATAVFFFISNLSYFVTGSFYTKDWTGLVLCYTAALPFLKSSLLGNIVWSMILFGCYNLFAKKVWTKVQSKTA